MYDGCRMGIRTQTLYTYIHHFTLITKMNPYQTLLGDYVPLRRTETTHWNTLNRELIYAREEKTFLRTFVFQTFQIKVTMFTIDDTLDVI